MSARLEELRPTRGDGSLMRTFIGSFLRGVGGWIPVGDVVELLGEVGVSAASVRTNLSRLKAKGLVVTEPRDGTTGYRLADDADTMLARGDRRIYGHRAMCVGDPWMVVVFSIPEAHRDLRHQLRSRLTWLGCGSLAPGAWIGPGHLVDETRDVLQEVGLLDYVTILRTETPLVDGSLADAVARWWDLPALNARYAAFIGAHEAVAERWARAQAASTPGASDAAAFADYLRALDDWRSIPYLDPALPTEYLPDYWDGERGVALFAQLHDRLHAASLRHVRAVTGRHHDAG